jgi:hypothetical protein
MNSKLIFPLEVAHTAHLTMWAISLAAIAAGCATVATAPTDKSAAPPVERSASPPPSESVSEDSRRIETHRFFSHIVLPSEMGVESHKAFLPLYTKRLSLTNWLHSGWQAAERALGFAQRGETNLPLTTVKGLSGSLETIAGQSAILVHLPPPETPNQAFYVAGIWDGKTSARVFVLKRRIAPSEQGAWVGMLDETIVRHEAEHTHVTNKFWAAEIPPTPHEFIAAIEAVVRDRERQPLSDSVVHFPRSRPRPIK